MTLKEEIAEGEKKLNEYKKRLKDPIIDMACMYRRKEAIEIASDINLSEKEVYNGIVKLVIEPTYNGEEIHEIIGNCIVQEIYTKIKDVDPIYLDGNKHLAYNKNKKDLGCMVYK